MELERYSKKNDQHDMPSEIICSVCERSRASSQYSSTQLTKLRRAMVHNRSFRIENQKIARCVPCTGSVTIELNCHKCGHILDVEQFSRNQRNRESPLCQPCMNYQLSLDSRGNVPTLQDAEEEVDDGFARLDDDPENTDSTSVQSKEQPNDESGMAPTRSGESSIDDSSSQEVTGKSGFARVKAHRAPREPVEPPTPAPGWASSGPDIRKDGTEEEGPWRGYKYI